MKKLLLSLLVVLMSLPAIAQSVLRQDGVIYTLDTPDDGSSPCAYVTGNVISEPTNLVIPEVVSKDGIDYPVTAIGNAFTDCTDLISVVIPNSVEIIANDAFYRCSGLMSVTIGNSVNLIGSEAFGKCTSLTSVDIPNSVISIYSYAFENSGLTSVTLPNSLKKIGRGCFLDCKNLKSVNIPNSVEQIDSWAFQGCSGLTYVDIPNSVNAIGEGAFYDCSSLKSVILPPSVTSVGTDAFAGCTGLIRSVYPDNFDNPFPCGYVIYYDSDSDIRIEDGFIWNTDKTGIYFVPVNLEGEYEIPVTVKTIGAISFYGCRSLTSVTIPNSVQTIGASAFSGCSGLTSVEIPNSVHTIGDFAFAFCTSLTSMTIPNSLQTIGKCIFWFCTGLTSVTIPNSVQTIGESAFDSCSSLTSVEIPNSVTSIGKRAFYDCSSLESVILPPSVTSVGTDAFAGCTSLIRSVYPDNFDNPFPCGYVIYYDSDSDIMIEDGFIWNTDKTGIYFVPINLEGEYEIPVTVKTIGAISFYGCKNLISVTIPNSVQTIGNSAFAKCSGLKEVNYNTTDPVATYKTVFDDNTYKTATLNVAIGGLDNAMATTPWVYFYDIRESDFAGIDEIFVDSDLNDSPVEVFNFNGVRVADSTDNLPAGLYIVRQGNKTQKVAVK